MVAPVAAGGLASFGLTPVTGFLLGMKAAGLVVDYFQTQNNKKLINMGHQLETEAINTNLAAVKLESDQASLNAMKDLNQNVAQQMVNNAARGTSSGVGTALTLQQESIRNYNDDERVRRMNLIAKQNNLRASGVMSGLSALQSETQLGQAMTSKIIDALPVSSIVDSFSRSPMGKKWGFGLTPVT